MLGSKRFCVMFCCLMLVLCSGRSMRLSANSNELESIYLDFEIALTVLKQGSQNLDENSLSREKALIGLGFELELALIDNENLRNSLKSQQSLVGSLQTELGVARQHSFDLENTLTATRKKAEIDLTEAVSKQGARIRLWQTLVALGGTVIIAETIFLLIK